MPNPLPTSLPRAATGIEGLDDVLSGGLTANRLYLIEGMPGSGKTTLAFQFLLEGVARGEHGLYLSLSETEDEIRAVAASHGWVLDGITLCELAPWDEKAERREQYTVFHPSEVELSETTAKIMTEVERTSAARVVVDSLSELRLLAGSPLRYRREILTLKRFLAGRTCTVLLLDDLTAVEHDLQVQSIAHGALLLEHTVPSFGVVRRRLKVTKFRGSDFRSGHHDYAIRRGGLQVYPRLVASEHRSESARDRLASGLTALDSLLGGGLERGTSTLVQGAAGTGKSTIAALFCAQAAERGENAAIFAFDERVSTLFSRMKGLGVDLRRHVDSGRLVVRQVDPAELSPGEFAQEIRHEAENRNASLIVIDSLNGYLNSMPDERFLVVQLHELLSYLGHRGVATVLIAAYSGMLGTQMAAPLDASYLADSVVVLRYFEAGGEVRQAISVVKMRGGEHERTIRELRMKAGRIHVGEPLRNYRGVLTGVPEEIVRP